MKKIFLPLLPAVLGVLTSCSTLGGESDADGLYVTCPSGPGETVLPEAGDRFSEFQDNPFVSTAEQPVSTFSVDADGASYAIMRRYLTNGYNVPVSSVRIEEFLNYFTFDYAAPTGDDAVAINAEVGPCPWSADHALLRLGLKGRELPASEVPLANYVFLVDVSGSMSGADRLDLLKSGLIELLGQLNPDDRISLITYSGEVRKLLESTPVKERDKITSAIRQLSAGGYTPGGAAMQMAYEEALVNFDPKKNNRIIMGTDGDFNVGVTSTDALVEMVEGYARQGIYLTCLGFGMGNLNDAMMEQISNKGNGTYHYIDSEDEMMKVFVHERERFVSVANDTKCQVTFNPAVVSQYRLIGYENRVMSSQDFDDDAKDAGEIGAGQTITALYELALAPSTPELYQQQLMTFDVRYKKALSDASLPLQLELSAGELLSNCMPSPDFYFSAGVAAYGMVLRNSPHKGSSTLQTAYELVEQGLSFDPHGYRAQLLRLITKSTEK